LHSSHFKGQYASYPQGSKQSYKKSDILDIPYSYYIVTGW